MLTNGENSQQNQKLQATGLANYFSDVFVSSEIGFINHSPKYSFTRARSLVLVPNPALMWGTIWTLTHAEAPLQGLRVFGVFGSIGGAQLKPEMVAFG